VAYYRTRIAGHEFTLRVNILNVLDKAALRIMVRP